MELDFSWAAFSIPVVNSRFVQLFERLGIQEVQFLPVQVEDHAGPYFILNTLRILRCIDEARCEEVRHWKPEDGQPEKVGQYRYIAGMRIDPTKVEGARIFRPWGWPLALIISEDLKEALEREGLTGTKLHRGLKPLHPCPASPRYQHRAANAASSRLNRLESSQKGEWPTPG